MLKHLLLLLLVFTVSCGKDHKQQSFSEELVTPISIDDPVPPEAETFKVNITYVNFTEAQKEKYDEAVEIVKKVVASDEFKYEVMNHTYNGQTTYFDNGGKSNGAIYLNILNANESLQPTMDNQMDVEVELYTDSSTTIGYTYPNTNRIWVNTRYFNSYTPAQVAGNLFHEWLHKLGYVHAVNYSSSRDYTVPYAIGRIVSSLGARL